jgi:hypothetical protein
MTSNRATQTGGRMVRPYTMTGGRTGAGQPPLALEALVAMTPAGMRMRSRFRWEAAEIVAHTRSETAIIELAALLDVPVGVVRVLVADLQEQGAVKVTDPVTEPFADDDVAYTDLLHKVLDGLHAL